jgi:hypothetical protein
MSEIMERMAYEAPVLPTGTSAFRAAGREKSRKSEDRKRLRRGGESRVAGGEMDSLFSYFFLHPSDFLCLEARVFPEGFMRFIHLSARGAD